jgi:hypothetical protein
VRVLLGLINRVRATDAMPDQVCTAVITDDVKDLPFGEPDEWVFNSEVRPEKTAEEICEAV